MWEYELIVKKMTSKVKVLLNEKLQILLKKFDAAKSIKKLSQRNYSLTWQRVSIDLFVWDITKHYKYTNFVIFRNCIIN